MVPWLKTAQLAIRHWAGEFGVLTLSVRTLALGSTAAPGSIPLPVLPFLSVFIQKVLFLTVPNFVLQFSSAAKKGQL